MAIDGVSLVNSIAGGFVIQEIDIFNYMKIVILNRFDFGNHNKKYQYLNRHLKTFNADAEINSLIIVG